MPLKDGDAEDDSAEIEELLAELVADESNSRYDNLHSSNDSLTSIMPTEESKWPPFLNSPAKEEEKACDAPPSHLRLAHSPTDASKNTMADMPPPKLSHTHHREMRVFSVDMPPSPPPPSPPPCGGCSCFLFPSHKRVKKQKKFSAEDQRSSTIKAKIQKGKAGDDDDNGDNDDEWRSVFKENGSPQMDAGGLFDVKNTEKEFKRASMKEKQLTQDAQKFLKMLASS